MQPPAITGLTPSSGETATAPTTVTASLAPPTGQVIHCYLLYHQLQGTADPIKISCATGQPPSDGSVATFDPTTLTNGIYDLIVTATATASSGGVSQQKTTVSVEGAL